MKNSPKFTFFNPRDVKTFFTVTGPFIFVLLMAAQMREFVWHAIEANLAINLGIISAAFFGVCLIIRRLLAAQEDFRIIERFGYEAAQGVYMKELLERPWLQNRYVRHYLSRIAHTGGTLSSHMEQSAIESELHALQVDYDSRLELPQFLVGFMIAMGLLGTFIGLLETLTGISGMLDGMGGGGDVEKQFMKLVVELRKPLAGMGIAFSASMFGLITSLMLSIMMTNLRRYISRVISLARNVMFELTEIAHETSHGVGLSPTEVSLLLANQNADGASSSTSSPLPSLPQVSAPVLSPPPDVFVPDAASVAQPGSYPFGGGIDPAMSGRFDVLTKKIEILLTAFQANIESTRKLSELIGFGPRMKEISEKTLDEIRGLAVTSSDQHALMQALVSGNAELTRTFMMHLDSQKLANGELSELMRKLSGITVDLRDAEISSGRHLNEIKENFTKLSFNKNSDMIEMIATSLSGQTALLEALLQESRKSQQVLSSFGQPSSVSSPKV